MNATRVVFVRHGGASLAVLLLTTMLLLGSTQNATAEPAGTTMHEVTISTSHS